MEITPHSLCGIGPRLGFLGSLPVGRNLRFEDGFMPVPCDALMFDVEKRPRNPEWSGVGVFDLSE
jgi:hypothetical protein